jgi:hypothetical protein
MPSAPQRLCLKAARGHTLSVTSPGGAVAPLAAVAARAARLGRPWVAFSTIWEGQNDIIVGLHNDNLVWQACLGAAGLTGCLPFCPSRLQRVDLYHRNGKHWPPGVRGAAGSACRAARQRSGIELKSTTACNLLSGWPSMDQRRNTRRCFHCTRGSFACPSKQVAQRGIP